MKSINVPLGVLSLCIGLGLAGAAVHAQTVTGNGGAWVRIGDGVELPSDLAVGDQVELSIGSAVSQRGSIVGFIDCGGNRTYYTSDGQSGCGWRNAITAYARQDSIDSAQANTDSALEVPQ